MSRLTIALDVDDVLYDTEAHIINTINEKHGTSYKHEDVEWNFKNMKPEHAKEALELYNDPEIVCNAPMNDGAEEFVEYLNEISNLYFVTATFPGVMEARVEQLGYDFNAESRQVVFMSDKDHFEADYLIDDRADKYTGFKGTRARYFSPRPLKEKDENVYNLKSYDDFATLIFLKEVLKIGL